MQDGRPVALRSPTSRTLNFPFLNLRFPTLRPPPLDSPTLFELIFGDEVYSDFSLRDRLWLLAKNPRDFRLFRYILTSLYPMIWMPELDLYEYSQYLFVARIGIPGITKEDVRVIFVHNIQIHQDFLFIYGNRSRPGVSPNSQYRYLCTRIESGPFCTTLHVPRDTRKETLHWCLEDGILKVMLHRNPWGQDPPPPVLMCRCTLMNPS